MSKRIIQRETVRETVFTLKVSADDRETLEWGVHHREGVINDMTGQAVRLSAGAFVRYLVLNYAKQNRPKPPGPPELETR